MEYNPIIQTHFFNHPDSTENDIKIASDHGTLPYPLWFSLSWLTGFLDPNREDARHLLYLNPPCIFWFRVAPGLFYSVRGTKNRTRHGRAVFAISNTWPTKQSLLRLVSWDKIFLKPAPNTRSPNSSLLTRLPYPIPVTTRKRPASPTTKLRILRPYNRTERTRPQHTGPSIISKISGRRHKCFSPAHAARAFDLLVHISTTTILRQAADGATKTVKNRQQLPTKYQVRE